MTTEPRAPAVEGLSGDAQRLAWLRQAYYGLDGRWYLKLRERWGPDAALAVDEEVCRSLGRLHVRTWLDLTGRDGAEDCRALGRFVLDVLDVLYGSADDAVRVVEDHADSWVMEHTRCTIYDMGIAAGYQGRAPAPGALPGCRGILALYEGWVGALGPFRVEQLPAGNGSGGVACRYAFTRIVEEVEVRPGGGFRGRAR